MAALRVAWGSRSAGTRGCGVRTCRPGPGRPGAGDGGSMEQRERGCGVPRLPGEPGPNRAFWACALPVSPPPRCRVRLAGWRGGSGANLQPGLGRWVRGYPELSDPSGRGVP